MTIRRLLVPLALVLAACGGGDAGPDAGAEAEAEAVTVVTQDLLERGAEVYRINCVACHGPEGKGDGPSAATLDPPPRDHTNREYMDGVSDEQIADTILNGGAARGYPNMPSNPHIRGRDLAAVVAFVRTLSRGREAVDQVNVPSS